MQGLVFLMESCALSRERSNFIWSPIYGLSLPQCIYNEHWRTLMNIESNWRTLLNIDDFSMKSSNEFCATGFLRQRSPSIWVDHKAGGAEDHPVSHRHHPYHCHHQRHNFHQKFKNHHNHCHQACGAIHWPHGEGEKLKLKFEQFQVILMITFWKYL